ncbi:SAM-dependent methyltransferase [Streptomyces sp. Ru71]|uniref:class I SAM-dependent methyltransferase n=1 Tax=Streptomyces sp. Ru71 TaxID=2080746 RepID=UPI000CDD246A|nr:class I SAM-dependent methyltransferase [Streptomyces sp. Ru71]POX50965.1 SAM-dependent methyltransferase [Streptomyces sp. Ru71]
MADHETGTAGEEIAPQVRSIYGPVDLSSVPAFAGGFINFGDWQGISLDRAPTTEDRIRSERNLYRRVLRALGPGAERARAVEVGCGIGLGAALALAEFSFAAVTGVDVHPDQLERAREVHADLLAREPERLRFVRGAAERMPFAGGEFDRLYSVEAAQHFLDLTAFARESARVLGPGGRLAVTSFFLPDDTGAKVTALAERLDSFATGLDRPHPLPALLDALRGAGLTDVRAESIGEHVWPGYDHFLAHVELPVTWPRNFLGAYRDGLLDYYLITARRPAG